MPRSGWVKPASGDRLSDRISVGVLTRVFPPALVDEVVAAAGRAERRQRLLPARLVVYYVLALALFSDASYEEVMRQLTEGLAWSSSWRREIRVPDKAAIARARERLGVEPLRLLFDAVAGPLATSATKGAFYREWRLVSLDGTCLDVADTPENAAALSRPGSNRRVGGGAFPQLRLVALCESGTNALMKVALGPYSTGERRLAEGLLGGLEKGMLCLADRGLYSLERFQAARSGGAEVLWRAPANMRLARERELEDGSYLSTVRSSSLPYRKRPPPAVVRVIEYRLEGSTEPSYRLLASILEPERAPATELAALYAQRWEVENALDELKTHQRGPRVVLRSKTPDGVYQEAYGYLLTHYAIRHLMHEAALAADLDPCPGTP